MTGGLIRAPDGGVILSPSGLPWVSGPAPVQPPPTQKSISPQSIAVLSDATPGTVITPLTLQGFTTPPTLTLLNNATNRVALSGSAGAGYSLVVGSGSLLPAGNYGISLTASGDTAVYTINLTVNAVSAGTTADLFTVSIHNADSITSWADQELSTGQYFKKGDVPSGTIVRAVVDGNPIPCQVSERIYWNDGSLKHAFVRMLVPAMTSGAAKTVTWQRTSGSWNDTALHSSPTAITGKVTLEFAMSSYKGRTVANALTAERGPLTFNSSTMLGAANTGLTPAPMIEKVMSGPICNEWRVSDFALTSTGAKHAHMGAFLYARAWGGTASSPKRIQFLFRTQYGWDSDVAADEQGFQADLNLRVNGAVVRGAAVATTNWGSVKGWKGNFLHSASTDGTMDWFDVATNSFVTPPKLVYRHNVAYGVDAKMIPPLDFTNPAMALTAAATLCYPGKRGPLRAIQDDVADAAMITWTTSQPVANALGAYSRGTPTQVANLMTTVRASGWGMGAMSAIGRNRTTRKIISYIPPEKQTNQAVLGDSVYGLPKTAVASLSTANSALNSEIDNLDAAHFPSMAFFPALLDGDQHFLDLVYQEVTLPGLFESPDYGFYGSAFGVRFGGISYAGQIRAVGHSVRPIVSAMGIGRPSDPHHQMAVDYFNHWAEMSARAPIEWDTNFGGVSRTDGRRMQDLKLLKPNNEPSYKIWMHSFGLHALSYGYGITEDPKVKERADWFSHAVIATAGGYQNDPDHLLWCDPNEASAYLTVFMDGLTSSGEFRRPWHFVQWRRSITPITYKADGQTVTLTSVANGNVLTVGTTRGAEPHWASATGAFPTGLTRGALYYAVQVSGGTSAKLSLTPGGTPVTFNTGAVDIVGDCIRTPVAGWHALNPPDDKSFTDSNGYPIQVGAALACYQFFCEPGNLRVAHARNNIAALKAASTNPSGYDARGKMAVPTIPTWTWTGAVSSSINVDTPTSLKLTVPSGAAVVTAARRYYTTVVGQEYTFTFTSDASVERRIGTAKDGSQILAIGSAIGAQEYTFTATSTQTWVYFSRTAAGTTTLTNVDLIDGDGGSAPASNFSTEFSTEFA